METMPIALFQKDVKSIRLRPNYPKDNKAGKFQKDVKSIRLRPKCYPRYA